MTHLWTPWRSTYMQQPKTPQRCILCEAAANPAEDTANFVLYRGARCLVLLNRYPYTSGHLMIAPYEHAARLAQTGEETTAEMTQLARAAERALEDVYRPDGLNIGMNLGEAAGAGIEQHIHLHVLPRWKGDTNFMSTTADTRIIPERLEDSYQKLKGRF